MDLIRLIKLKKINGELDNLDEKEELFFSLFDGLYTFKEKNVIYFFDENGYYFQYNLKTKDFWCSYSKVWTIFEDDYHPNYSQISNLISDIMKKHLNLVVFATSYGKGGSGYDLEKHLNLVNKNK